MNDDNYSSLTELGAVFGVTRNAIGKRLKELGLRTHEGKPSQKAFNEGFVSQRWGIDRDVYNWVWHQEKTIAELEQSGLKKAESMDGVDFIFRQVGTTGQEILNADGEVFAWTVDEKWATKIIVALNRDE
jgi:hypothetical protein